MPLNLILAQSIVEFNFIRSKIKESYTCLPLNLDLLLFCEVNKIPYIDLNEYLDNKIHINGLIESENFLKHCNFADYGTGVFKARYINLVRNYFNSVFFLKFVLLELNKKRTINKIYLSGWNNKDIKIPKNNSIILEICKIISSKIYVVSETDKTFKNKEKIYSYASNYYKKKTNSKKIIFLNFGYNFKRIFFNLLFRKYKIIYLTFEKIKFIKQIVFKILGVDIFYFYKKKIIDKKISNVKLNEFYHDKDILKILNYRNQFFYTQIQDLEEKCKAIKKLIHQLEPKIVFLNLVRGVDGYIASLSREFNFESICIPHGTITNSFNEYDKIYKKIIAENVFSGDSKYFAIQSKITEKSLSTHKISGKAIITGNLIFSDINKNKIKKRKKILYAVTMKDFINYQFFGVEMYYEFYENLKFLDKFAKEENYKIIVKPHPSIIHLTDDLKKIFKNLIFSREKVENLLKKVFLTISFSSTVIEDSICNKIPVVLLDQWNRYKHCHSCGDPEKINQFIYYINKKEELSQVIKTIKNSDKENYTNFIFDEKNTKKNINKLIKNLQL